MKTLIQWLVLSLPLVACDGSTERGGFQLGSYRPRVNTVSATNKNATSSSSGASSSSGIPSSSGGSVSSSGGSTTDSSVTNLFPPSITVNSATYVEAAGDGSFTAGTDVTTSIPSKFTINDVLYSHCSTSTDAQTTVSTSSLPQTISIEGKTYTYAQGSPTGTLPIVVDIDGIQFSSACPSN